MTEKEKMLSGQLYLGSEKEIAKDRYNARLIFQKANKLGEEKADERIKLFYSLFGKAGKDLWIEPPFYCDY